MCTKTAAAIVSVVMLAAIFAAYLIFVFRMLGDCFKTHKPKNKKRT